MYVYIVSAFMRPLCQVSETERTSEKIKMTKGKKIIGLEHKNPHENWLGFIYLFRME